jgi:hypothetical protein
MAGQGAPSGWFWIALALWLSGGAPPHGRESVGDERHNRAEKGLSRSVLKFSERRLRSSYYATF